MIRGLELVKKEELYAGRRDNLIQKLKIRGRKTNQTDIIKIEVEKRLFAPLNELMEQSTFPTAPNTADNQGMILQFRQRGQTGPGKP
jgi:hypothetical protein